MIDKSLDNKNIKYKLLRHVSQNGLFINKLILSLRKFRLNDQKFIADKPILNIKYYYSGS